MSDDVRALILAGGAATRFGRVTQVLPKCLLPVSPDETLLTRVLNHLEESGFRNVTVSTSPAQFDLLKPVLDRTAPCAVLLRNEAHAAGPLPAMLSAIRQVAEPYTLLCLSDIFFTANPFTGLRAGNVLLACREMEAPASGFLESEGGLVTSLSYRDAGPDAAYWPGVALFEREAILPLLENAALAQGPLEAVFAAALASGIAFRAVACPAFVNVNTPADWHRALRLP